MTAGQQRAVCIRRATTHLIAVGLAILVGAAMVVAGRPPDPWTLALVVTVAAATATAAPVRQRLRLRRDRSNVEPVTAVGDARVALVAIESERERARAYDTVFSVTVLDVHREALPELAGRKARRVLSDLTDAVARDVRVTDQVCHVPTSDRDLVIVVLPDTAARGARMFASRLMVLAEDHLAAHGLDAEGLRSRTITHPADSDGIDDLERRLEVLEGTDALIRDVAVARR